MPWRKPSHADASVLPRMPMRGTFDGDWPNAVPFAASRPLATLPMNTRRFVTDSCAGNGASIRHVLHEADAGRIVRELAEQGQCDGNHAIRPVRKRVFGDS